MVYPVFIGVAVVDIDVRGYTGIINHEVGIRVEGHVPAIGGDGRVKARTIPCDAV
jgi:hypothetical protein